MSELMLGAKNVGLVMKVIDVPARAPISFDPQLEHGVVVAGGSGVGVAEADSWWPRLHPPLPVSVPAVPISSRTRRSSGS